MDICSTVDDMPPDREVIFSFISLLALNFVFPLNASQEHEKNQLQLDRIVEGYFKCS